MKITCDCGREIDVNVKPLQNETGSIVNFDLPPKIPYECWTVEEHLPCGEVDFSKLDLYLTPEQEKGGWVEGHELRKQLKGKLVLNSNVLDYLLVNPELIPGSWKGKYVYFWGTIFRNSDGLLCVRCVYFLDGQWQRRYYDLGSYWGVDYPTAVAS